VALVVCLAAGCGRQDEVETPPVVRPIKMTEIGEPASSQRREYPGRIAASLEAEVSFEIPGRIVNFPVKEGDLVSKGEPLASLDPSDYEAQVTAARADLRAAEADYERFRELLEKSAVSEREFQTRERNFEVAKSRLQIVEKSLADTELSAPFEGRVARKMVDTWQNVQAKQPVVLLQDDSVLEIRIDVPEADLALSDPTKPPSEVRGLVTITAFPEHFISAKLTELSTAADPVTRTFAATFSFESPDDLRILSGMTAQVTVLPDQGERPEGSAYAVPVESAATGDDGRAFVWKIDPGTMQASRLPVELGEFRGKQVLIESGVAPGDLIAASGVHHLREGMKVRRLSP
jgi:RND family efflux transporter MFP subunit